MAADREDRSTTSRAGLAGIVPLLTGAAAGLFILTGARVDGDPEPQAPAPVPAVSIAIAPSDPADIRAAETHLLRVAVSFPEPAAHENVPVPRRKPHFWRVHQTEEARYPQAPKVAVIIDDMGLDVRRSARVVSLAGPLTLSYLPYANNLQRQAAIARSVGHELLVHVPMEPRVASASPGPNVLKLGLRAESNIRRLSWALSRFDGFVGINNHMGSRFTRDEASMWPVLRELKRRELLFVDSLTDRRSVAGRIAGAIGLPFVKRDIFLDHVDDAKQIRDRLADLEKVARAKGAAVAIGHPRDATIAALREWIPKARARGLEFVPISRIVRDRQEPLIGSPGFDLPDEAPA